MAEIHPTTPVTMKARGRSIVVIDDDEKFREQMAELLAETGCNVYGFESGNHAFRFFDNQVWSWVPQLVIADIVMDGMGGYQVVRRIEEIYPRRDIPVIIVSKLTASDYVYEAEAAGAVAYIAKPIGKTRLFKMMDLIKEKSKKDGKKERIFITDFGKSRPAVPS